MIRRRIVLFFAVATACAVSAGAGAQTTAQIRCPEGHPATGDLGIQSLLCVGGSCSVNLRSGQGYTHDFSTEPRIRGLEPDGPASGKLRNGDILISIDGVLITTREGGRRLANLTPGKSVTLRIRRSDQGIQEMDVQVVPKLGCNMPRLAVLGGSGTVTPAFRRDQQPPEDSEPEGFPLPSPRDLRAAPGPVDFGMEIECGSCGWRFSPEGALVFYTLKAPVVLSVEPGGPAAEAGLKEGDVLLRVENQPFSGPGGEILGRLRPGRSITLQVGRGGSLRTVQIVPRAARQRRQPF